jgi:ABC-2 type transport system ATP-binding protein
LTVASLTAAPGEDRVVRVRADGPISPLFSLTRWAIDRDLALPDLEVRRPSLEDVYLELTRTVEEART